MSQDEGARAQAPLVGVKVIEFSAPGPVAHAARTLALLGADVVRVVRPGAGAPSAADSGRPYVELDLKQAADLALAQGLATRADVLIEGFRPGVMDRIGLGGPECCALNLGLVYVRVSGWGREGVLAQSAGHDLNYVATSGLLSIMAPAGGSGFVPPPILADIAGGAHQVVVAALSGLVRRAHGAGGVVDVALIDGAVALTAPFWARRERPVDQQPLERPFYRTYPTADGSDIAVACIEDKFYARFLEGLGLAGEDVPDRRDSANWPRLTALFGEIIAGRSRAEWITVFGALDACVSPVLSPEEARRDPHLVGRGLLPTTLSGRVEPPLPIRYDGAPPTGVDSAAARALDPGAVLSAWSHEQDPA
ncbi:CaiB/BaiF CoA transferase family protein [Nocardioides nitrophenolicus]|uniref:CaiB/BaiF CoA transferase family protein n=1 Tax=Nocardioides nitrophenolicus TaxID=60489 RepID=UPI00195E3A27|nr:CaiB/BaiF CoA-transferase family protein [Nocardioides nitrophenolicus]MBM7516955.1 alpha-methylacyl-CoA racemase [Nocardioides nitrophenolicus]